MWSVEQSQCAGEEQKEGEEDGEPRCADEEEEEEEEGIEGGDRRDCEEVGKKKGSREIRRKNLKWPQINFNVHFGPKEFTI